jgi:DNA-binding transcriptional ArsR family regulator
MPEAKRMDAVFRALADPGRRKLLDRLFESSGLTLSQLCERMAMSRQAVSQHLALLEEANLISTTWRGREKLHFLNPVPIHEIYDRWVMKFERRSLRTLEQLRKRLEGERHD